MDKNVSAHTTTLSPIDSGIDSDIDSGTAFIPLAYGTCFLVLLLLLIFSLNRLRSSRRRLAQISQ